MFRPALLLLEKPEPLRFVDVDEICLFFFRAIASPTQRVNAVQRALWFVVTSVTTVCPPVFACQSASILPTCT